MTGFVMVPLYKQASMLRLGWMQQRIIEGDAVKSCVVVSKQASEGVGRRCFCETGFVVVLPLYQQVSMESSWCLGWCVEQR